MLFFNLWMLLLLPQTETAAPEERVRVDYVLVEVTARDARERLVTDLTLADFVLRDGGEKIALESLDILDLRGGDAAPAPVGASVIDARLPRLRGSRVVLAIDLQFADRGGVNETFRQLEDYLEGTIEHSDLSYLVYSLESGALMEDFVTDPSVALEALRAYRSRYEERQQGLRRDDEVDDLRELEQRIDMCGGGPGYANCVRDALHAFLEFQNARTETVMRELESLIDRFPDNERLHSIVFISPGFSLHPGSAGVQLAAYFLGQGEGTDLASRVGGGLPGTLSFEDRMKAVVETFAQKPGDLPRIRHLQQRYGSESQGGRLVKERPHERHRLGV